METPLLSNGEGRMKTGGAMVVVAAADGTKDEEVGRVGDVAAADVPALPPVRNLVDAWEVFVGESKRLWLIALPIGLSVVCLYGMNSTTQIFVGHLGNLQLSAVAIGLSVISNFSFGFLVEMLGVYLQRSWIILVATSFLLCPLYIFSTPVLKLLGQEDEIAELAGKFTVSIIPQMFALAINFPTQKFLQAQSKVVVLAWIGIVSLLIHIGLLALFILVFKWGMGGAAAAYNISSWMISIAQVIYVVGWCKDGWTGLSWSAFKDIWAFVRLSLASAVMICLEIWYMMVLVVLTGHLDNAEIAVGSISICMNINGWEGMVFIGLNAAIRATKYAVIVVIVESLMIGILAMITILGTRNSFSIIFTEDKDLQRAVADIAYLLGITMLLNSVQPVISGNLGWHDLWNRNSDIDFIGNSLENRLEGRGPILKLLRQEDEIANLAGKFTISVYPPTGCIAHQLS
ncbi:protein DETOXIFICATION 34 [Cocos nucifera]|uniref:Protein DETOXIFICATION n=1 Tax=Cocos nucifera TaxID=13894 RepID=A0A8K0IM27_COCNU|nr:protein DETOXIFICATION 34 [Cocos nucifera]